MPAFASNFPPSLPACTICSLRYGAKLVEINPLILTKDGRVIAADAKVELDDDALFRHPEFKEWQKTLPLDDDETLAAQAGLGIRNFRTFPGTVGTMANGAGLAMATMDAVKNAGGEIANFLDVGGGANAERVRNCYELVVNHTGAKVFFINIFGGHHSRRRSCARHRRSVEHDESAQDSARHSSDRNQRRRGAAHSQRSRHDAG